MSELFAAFLASILPVWDFVAVVIGGAVLKLLLSERLGWRQAAATGGTAVFCALVFTDPTLRGIAHFFTAFQTDDFRLAVAALWTLLGEGIVRGLIAKSDNGSLLARIFKEGKK